MTWLYVVSLQNLHLLPIRLSAVWQYKMHCFEVFTVEKYRDIETHNMLYNYKLQLATANIHCWPSTCWWHHSSSYVILLSSKHCSNINYVIYCLYEMKYYFVIVIIVVVLIATSLSVELVYVNNTREKLGIMWFVLRSVIKSFISDNTVHKKERIQRDRQKYK